MKPQLKVVGFSSPWQVRAQGEQDGLSDVTFEMAPSTVTALIGPNGSGKTTLMKVVAGLLPHSAVQGQFQVEFQGKNFLHFSSELRARSIAYVPSEIHTEFPLTAYEVVALGRRCWSTERFWSQTSGDARQIEQAMHRAWCWDLRDRDFSSLSGGEKQRVGLARALAQQAPVLFLDEALSQLDLNHQGQVRVLFQQLVQEGVSILLVGHDLNLVLGLAEFGIFLKEGQVIAQGSLQQCLQPSVLEAMYPGLQFTLGTHPLRRVPQVFFAADPSSDELGRRKS
jgi:iron complex transport system ATP-binding protein